MSKLGWVSGAWLRASGQVEGCSVGLILGLWLLRTCAFRDNGRDTRDQAKAMQARFTSPLSSTHIPLAKASPDDYP